MCCLFPQCGNKVFLVPTPEGTIVLTEVNHARALLRSRHVGMRILRTKQEKRVARERCVAALHTHTTLTRSNKHLTCSRKETKTKEQQNRHHREAVLQARRARTCCTLVEREKRRTEGDRTLGSRRRRRESARARS